MSTENIINKLTSIVSEAEELLKSVSSSADIELIRVKYFGRKSEITALSKEMGSLTSEERPIAGKAFNDAKLKINDAIENSLSILKNSLEDNAPKIDISLPGKIASLGYKHPITQIIDDCVSIFRRMGFIVAEGPDIETVFHCFDALNTPKDHPSRDKSDTFYFPDGRLLRTQTSTVQVRVMESRKPPIRIIAPGPCFRPDTPDATHSANFHQIEGLYIDKNVSMSDLKNTLMFFAKELLGEDVKIRFRPHFFPFTEPSVEYDLSCILCAGKGCSVCKHSGWLEISGAGMVDPNVLKNLDLDPEIWSGFAFGMGVERIAMLKHRINDIRLFYDNNIKFLQQF